MTNCLSCGPSLPKKVSNYTKAIIKHTVDGFKNTPDKIQEKRLSICKMCPFRNPESDVLICTHEDCGCFIQEKIVWASEKCPIGLWDKYIEDKDLDNNNNKNTPQS